LEVIDKLVEGQQHEVVALARRVRISLRWPAASCPTLIV
jgi:hypothetical protein